jgi:hypothetical protein
MDVRLPNGQVISNVPDGTTKAQIAQKLQGAGFEVPQEWLAPAEPPPATAMDRAGAVASGFNRGVAGMAGIPVDTAANVQDLAKAIAGSLIGLFNKSESQPILNKEGKPAYYDVDEDGNLVPGATQSVARIPDALQIRPRSEVFGSGEYIANKLDQASQAVTGQAVTQMPRPDDTASRYLYAAGASLPMAATGPKTGVPLTPSVAANVAGSQAAQVAAENDVGPAGQVLAGTLAGIATTGVRPALAEATKRLFRGGEAGRQRTAQNIQDFEAAGTTPSAGSATQSRRVQAAESFLSKLPGSAGRMAAKGDQLSKDLGSNIERLASQLSPKASGEQAGRAITKGVTGDDGFIAQFKTKSAQNYDQLDNFVKKDAPFALPKTTQALDDLTKPIPGAEKTSKFFVNSTIRSIKEAMDADLGAGKNTIPYEAVKKIRSIVGEQLADAPFAGDVPRSQWKKLYSALSDDIEVNAAGAGQQAKDALSRANRYHAAGMKRIDAISAVIDKNGGPEAVFRAATSGAKEGATTLRAVMQSLPNEARKVLSASVLRRLGRSTPGKQDALGEAFSTETFLTNWNTLSPQAKAVLFDRFGSAFRQDMDAVASVASNLRSGSKVFQNPSGTAQAGLGAATAGAFALSVLQGNVGTATAIGGGVATANLASRLLTYPRFVKWLAKTTKAPPQALPALLVQLEQGASGDEKEFARLVRATAETRPAEPARQ